MLIPAGLYEMNTMQKVMDARAKKGNVSLNKILSPGSKIKFNAVLLAKPLPNPSRINYYCTGAIYGSDSYRHFVPILPILSSKTTANANWKSQYATIIGSLG